VKSLILIFVIFLLLISTNVSQGTLVENYFDMRTENLFPGMDTSTFDDSTVLALPARCHRDSTYLAGDTFTQRVANDPIDDFLLVTEKYPIAYFSQTMHITPSGAQNSILARPFNQGSFRYPFERLVGNITGGDGMQLQQDMFMPITRLAENRSPGQKPTTNLAHQTTKRRFNPTLRIGVASWNPFRVTDSNFGKIYHIRKASPIPIPRVISFRLGAYDGSTAATQILNGQGMFTL